MRPNDRESLAVSDSDTKEEDALTGFIIEALLFEVFPALLSFTEIT